MQTQPLSRWQKIIQTFKINNSQTQFGSYAAELSFYVIWAIVPVLLALANVIAILPVDNAEVITMTNQFIPEEIREILHPILEDYLKNASSGIFSLGLILSLWPASNVFNTLQRVFNTIYKVENSKNMIISRLFSYLFTIIMVILVFVITSIMVFGERIIEMVQKYLPDELDFLEIILRQGWILGIVLFFALLVLMYQFIPNVSRPIKYAIPGAIFSLVGFLLISQLFTVYLNFSSSSISNQTLGIFIVLMIWLYFISMVLTIGAYLNVFYYDYKHPEEAGIDYSSGETYVHNSDEFQENVPILKGKVYRQDHPKNQNEGV